MANTPDRLLTLGLVGLGLAHELASPLTTSALALELLAERVRGGDLPAAQIGEELDAIVGRVRRMSALVARFRQFATDPGGQRAPVDLAEVVRGVVHLVAPALKTRSRVRLVEGTTQSHIVQADRVLLEQATACLVLNAAEVLEPRSAPGTIRLSVLGDGARVGIEVLDDGPGFAAPDRAAEPGHTTRANGMGVGLALATRLVEAFDGRLDLGNHPTGGAFARIQFDVE